ncbi:MAG TPA: hypothetical protein VK673_22005 [Chthoniobacterales bacterium]|nr:hypothetical protein [Chthoniobacterales bacterium]
MRFRHNRYRKDDIMEAAFMTEASKAKRVPYYHRCRDLFLYGGDPLQVNRANKIKPTILTQGAFLYAPQSINFWLDIPPQEEDPEAYSRLDPTADNLLLNWHDSKCGKKFRWCVNWSLVYGATILSILPRLRTDGSVEIRSDFINPADFGVWDDMQPDMGEQEAVSLTNYITYAQVKRMLEYHPNPGHILNSLMTGQRLPAGYEGMIQTPPNASIYNIDPSFWKWYWQAFDYTPVQRQPTFEIKDVYAWDDDLEDYMLFTLTGDTVIFDRPMSYACCPGLLPFVKVCADEHPEWFWGMSLAEDLAKLQMWYQDRMDDLDMLAGKVADPPVAAVGVGQAFDEKIAQYKRKSGKLTLPPGSDFKSFQPDMPQSLFEFVGGISEMMDEQAGHKPPMLGKMGAGGRGGEAMQAVLKVAGSQMLAKAYEIELNAQDAGQLLMAYGRRYDDSFLIDNKGNKYLLADMPSDIKVRVDGHSSSPVFAQNAAEVAYMLHRAGAIQDSMLLRLTNIPQLSRALYELRGIEFQKNISKFMVQELQNQKRSGQFEGAKK